MVLGAILVFALVFRKHKALAMLVSTYIAFFVTNAWSGPVLGFLNGDRMVFSNVWIRANANLYTVSLILFFLFILLLSLFVKLGGKRNRYSSVEVVIYCICTTALWLSFILQVMPESLRDLVIHGSKVAPYIWDYRDYILVAPVLLMIYFGIYHAEEI